MKNLHAIVIALLTFYLVTSCKTEQPLHPQKTIITGYVSNLDKHKNKTWLEFVIPDLFALTTPFQQIEIDSLGNFRYEFDLVSPTRCVGIYKVYFDFVISPGDSLHINMNADIRNYDYLYYRGDSIKISGTVQPDYDKILDYKLFEFQNSKFIGNSFILNVIDTIRPNAFIDLLQLAKTEREQGIKKFGKECNAGNLFYEVLHTENKYKTLYDLIRYCWMAPINANKQPENKTIPKDYLPFLEGYDFKNNDFFVLKKLAFIRELQFYLEFKNADVHQTYLDIRKQKDSAIVPNDYFTIQANYIVVQTQGITKDLCLYRFAMENLQKIPSKSAEIYAAVLPLMNDPYVKKRFDEEFQKLNLEMATTFKDVEVDQFTALDSVIELNKGKIIYVDFWAPWCGPCMAEMKPSKKLHEKFKAEDIVFVYVGCRCSEKSWKAAMANHNIDGTNILLTDHEYAVLSKRFDIPGIPYFLLVDKQGNIMKNAPRPSDENIQTLILNMN